MWSIILLPPEFSYKGSNTEQLHQQLCMMVAVTTLGEVLTNKMDGDQCEALYRHYLHDFVHSVHKCPHKIKENRIYEYKVRNALYVIPVIQPTYYPPCKKC